MRASTNEPSLVAQVSNLLYRSASSLRTVRMFPGVLGFRRPADWKSAIQQVANLRYLGCGFAALLALSAAAADTDEPITKDQPGKMVQKINNVNFIPPARVEVPARKDQPLDFGEGLHTLQDSSASVVLSDTTGFRMQESTRLTIQRPSPGARTAMIKLSEGQVYVSSRGLPESIGISTPFGDGVALGTEYLVRVDLKAGLTEVTMFDGEVKLSNDVDTNTVRRGQQGISRPGQKIDFRPIQATNIVQWWIYYPGILDPEELGLTPDEQAQLAPSLNAYRSGDLQAALRQYPGYPTPAEPASEANRIYLAGLFLSLGAVDRAEAQLANVSADAPLAIALRTMIAAVQSDVAADVRRRSSNRQEARASSPRQNEAKLGRSQLSTFNSQLQTTNVGDDVRSLTNPTLNSQLSTFNAQRSSSEWLALSYQHQSTNGLKQALASAHAAVERSTNFGFGWARVAELEFSFGRTRAAREAVQRALELTPRNAQAHALNGFLLAADNRIKEAIAAFDQAIAIDPALGNAWLGRGLCRIRASKQYSVFSNHSGTNRANAGDGTLNTDHRLLNTSPYDDLATAAILEPTRSLVRSYLGKAFTDAGNARLAQKELAFARQLDPNDPTPWLYSALLNREQNRINPAVDDLEKSIDLNDNRALYRSRFLLDEDRAVRSSSLANVYQTAGMNDVSLREAARAVSYDYANYSAHLFLSDSYNALRDPTRFNLRYETVWFNELLLANLLSPVGGTPLSQHVSQQEYARLFDHDRLGLSTDTSYRSDGQYRELASQFGVIGKLGYSLDLDCQHNDGVRPNNDLDRIEWYSTIKYQLTPQDSALLLIKYQDYHSGDNFQYFDPTNTRPNFRFDEFQHPIILGGYHHEWAPGVHTLFLGGRLENDQQFSDLSVALPRLYRDTQLAGAPVTAVDSVAFDVKHRSELEIYTAEFQQILESEWQTLLLGARWQGGQFDTHDDITNPSVPPADVPKFANPPADVRAVDDFERVSGYGYFTLKLPASLRLTAGLTYEHLRYPENFRFPPIRSGQETRERFNPKAAVVWSPLPAVTLRSAYTRSLGGVSLDESVRLEPAQLAGFNQAFRTLIPESAVGSVAAPDHETYDAAIDLKLNSRTYLGLHGEILRSKVSETVGVFDYFFAPTNPLPNILPSGTTQRLSYHERSAGLSLNHLLADEWSIGARYDYTRTELDTFYPSFPEQSLPSRHQAAGLHRFGASLLFNHPSGFFALAESQWFFQESAALNNAGTIADVPSQTFQQLNLYVGYRFPRQRGDLTLGVQNLTDQDYRFVPLIAHEELPRERVFFARLRFRF